MAYTSDEEYERGAQTLRIDTDVDDRFCPDLIFVLNRLKEKKRINDWNIVRDQNISGKAQYDSDTRIITLSESTFKALDNFSSKIERRAARFTVAHELAHYYRRHEGLHYRGSPSLQLSSARSRLKMNEADANRFAGAFLIPFHLAKRTSHERAMSGFSIEDLSEIFDVNPKVAQIRKPVMEGIDRRLEGVPRLLPDSITDFLRKLQDQGHKISSLEIDDARRRKIAKEKGYQEKPCPHCKKLTVRKTAVNFSCESCGQNWSY